MLKAIIIDDENLCIASLHEDLKKFSEDILCLEVFNNPILALSYLKNNPIDLVFLDIEMPEMNGFELLEQLNNFNFKVIFTTAYDHFAVQAFRLSALDYLLKPINFKELTQAIDKAKFAKQSQTDKNIVLTDLNSMDIVKINDIVYCESDKNYTTFHFKNGKNKLVSKNIGMYDKMLSDCNFYRIHQSYLVNLAHVVEIKKGLQFKIKTILNNHLPVAKLKRNGLMEKFN